MGLPETIHKERYAQHGEETWSDTAMRIAKAISKAEQDDQIDSWTDTFHKSMVNFDFIPGGRIISNAGKAKQYMMNCVSGDTPIHTEEGVMKARVLAGAEIGTLSQGGKFRKAKWDSYGKQILYAIELKNSDEILYATADHEWVVTGKNKKQDIVTTSNLVGRHIPYQHISDFEYEEEKYLNGIRHGIVFGDGWLRKSTGKTMVVQFKENVHLIHDYFDNARPYKYKGYEEDECIGAIGLDGSYKQLPLTRDRSYLRGFIAGWLATDGHVDKSGFAQIYNKSESVLMDLKKICSEAGITTASIKMTRKKCPYSGADKPVYRLNFIKASMYDEKMVIKESHKKNMFRSPEPKKTPTRKVVAVTEFEEQEVFCCVEPETHTMVIGSGFLTKQCNLLDLEDSRESIGTLLKDILVVSGTGGGVGVSYSSLRPKGSPIQTSGGVSSGSISFMHCADTVAGTIKTGGGRRAALMLSLSASHPDILDFLHEKLDLGKLNNANISVEIDQKFIDAVKNDEDWELIWAGKTQKTVKAREIWDILIKNALESGEPGIMNLGLMKELSNSEYFAPVAGTNPCGEQSLEPFGSCCLGSVNISNFAREKYLDVKGFKQAIEVAVRFLDNVISVNTFPLENIRLNSTSSRRIGLGVTGLHYAMLKLGIKYGSDEGVAFTEKAYEILRNHSYSISTQLAEEKGAFPKFDRNKYLEAPFVKSLPTKIRTEIREKGIRNVCLNTQAPCGTTSILANVSSGIEPIFAPVYERRYRSHDEEGNEVTKVEVISDELFSTWTEEGKDITHFEGSHDISPEWHIKVQEAAQRYIDSAVSKTVNLPKDYSAEDLSKLLLHYMPNLKGITVYKDGSRGDSPLVPLDPSEYKNRTEGADDIGKGAECSTGACEI